MPGRRTEPDCPKCKNGVLGCTDSRPSAKVDVLRRRYKTCRNCGYRCVTHEVIVSDNHGFANSHERRVMAFVDRVNDLAKELYDADGKHELATAEQD